MSDYSFCDIDGNDIFENDFGLFLSAGKMRYGMLCGKRVITERGTLLNFSEAYKLNDENLSKKQFEHKKIVQIKYDEYHSKKETKKKLSRIAAKDLEIGQAYTSINGDVYIYLGHGSLTKTSKDNNKEVDTGFIYIRAGYCFFKDYNNVNITSLHIDRYLLTDMFLSQNMECYINVLKTRKKLIAKVDYKSPISKKNFNYYYKNEWDNCKEILKFEF